MQSAPQLEIIQQLTPELIQQLKEETIQQLAKVLKDFIKIAMSEKILDLTAPKAAANVVAIINALPAIVYVKGLNPILTSSGEKYIVFNFDGNNYNVNQTEYTWNVS